LLVAVAVAVLLETAAVVVQQVESSIMLAEQFRLRL
jgi:hypothetical protein